MSKKKENPPPGEANSLSYEEFHQNPANHNLGTERGRWMLEESFKRFGAGRSAVAAADGGIIAGNHAIEIAHEMGLPIQIVETDGNTFVVVKRTDIPALNDPQAQEFAIADNRAGQVNLRFDPAVLQELRKKGVKIADWFLPQELKRLAKGNATERHDRSEEHFEALDEMPHSDIEAGQVFSIGQHRLMCGDSTDLIQVKRLTRNMPVHLVVTSPPYPGWKEWQECGEALVQTGYVALKNCVEVLHDGGVICWNTSDLAAGNDGYHCNSARDTMAALELGLTKRGEFVWDKGISGMMFHGFNRRPCIPNNTHEFILVFVKGEWTPREKHPILSEEQMGWARESVWRIGTESAKRVGHKAPFPLELPFRCISLMSLESDIVYEPFAGSGTTMVAADKLGRICYAMEKEPHYCDLIIKRMETETGVKATLLEDGKNEYCLSDSGF